jgi:hypothetical protein
MPANNMETGNGKTVDPKEAQTYKFKMECHGRDNNGQHVLEEPVVITLTFNKPYISDILRSVVKCEYLGGRHGNKCRAIEKELGNNGELLGTCPYILTIG